MSKWIVRYKVFGRPESAGPYAAHEVLAHAEDIGGYMGVTELKVVPESAPTDCCASPKCICSYPL